MRRADAIWVIIIIGLGWNLLGAAQQNIDPAPDWLKFRHESGTEYIVRTKNIIGIISPTPGDPKKRNSILLSNGQMITSSLDLPDFQNLVESQGAEVQSVER